ncbi:MULTISPECIES: PTS lactose/cellobiose transporter subunit IIA [Clostridium]|jgi:PTS system cellobiose-specific IIA component|uniref:Phosphotransferase system cellobiose-specific component IIA n=3 Tax=Clostridium TaxID=1485 RepID=U2PZN5_9CLOT|nr:MULTISPECIES: PTS lactose/cellobiose transporter subunit IIA [Clostridium]ERK29254.1 phosphotransferase system cellobiose-specific component IIA [Clostridium intestinale URNW]QLY80732.1 PTS lactose/cellobiose transporter subunit IIA [Clostridium intestinale]WRY50502.1 PTS lactose/cellobiose transporter subunit IIA [Clostridium intestinale]
MSELEQVIMNIIINSGDAKGYSYEALNAVNEGNYEEADQLIEKANEALEVAHNAQTDLLQKEAAGEKTEVSVLFVHAQDHLMTTITEKNLIEQIMELRKIVNKLVK